MADEALAFELLLTTNAPQVAQDLAASLEKAQSVTTDLGVTLTSTFTDSEKVIADNTTALKDNDTELRSWKLSSESAADTEARYDKLLGDMNAKLQARLDYQKQLAAQPPVTAPMSEASYQNLVSRQLPGGGFAPQGGELPPPEEAPPETPGGGGGRFDYMGFRQARFEMMGVMIAAQSVEQSMQSLAGTSTQASTAIKVGMEGARAATNAMMLSMMAVDPAIIALVIGIQALSFGFQLLTANEQQAAADAKAAADAIAKPYEDLIAEVDKVAPATDSLKKDLQDLLGVSQEAAAQMEANAKASADYASALDNAINAVKQMVLGQHDLKAAQEAVPPPLPPTAYAIPEDYQTGVDLYQQHLLELGHSQDQLQINAIHAADNLEYQKQALQDAAAAASDDQAKTAQLNNVLSQGVNVLDAFAQHVQAAFSPQVWTVDQLRNSVDSILTTMQNATNPVDNLKKAFDEAKSAEQGVEAEAASILHDNSLIADPIQRMVADWKDAIRQAQQYDDIVKGIASAALQPTTVTPMDMAQTQSGTYQNKWDEFARRMKSIQEGGAASEWANPQRWKDMTPPDGLLNALARGDSYLKAWAASEAEAFYNGQLMGKIDYSGLRASVDTQINDIIGKFELMQAAEQTAAQELENLANTDPAKFKEFLKAENLAPDTSAQDAAKAAFSNIAKGIDPAQKAASDYKTTIDGIKGAVSTTASWIDAKARSDIDDFKNYLDDFIKHFGGVDVNVTATTSGPTIQTAGTPPPGYQTGGHFVVPPGYGGDRYPLSVSSGERVIVEPTTNSTGFINQAYSQIAPTQTTGSFVDRVAQAYSGGSPHSDFFNRIVQALESLPANFGPGYAGKELMLRNFGQVTVPVSLFHMDEKALAQELHNELGSLVGAGEIEQLAQMIYSRLGEQVMGSVGSGS